MYNHDIILFTWIPRYIDIRYYDHDFMPDDIPIKATQNNIQILNRFV